MEFQHTAAQRRLLSHFCLGLILKLVSTHSRAEAAASWRGLCGDISAVSTHSHPKVAAFIVFTSRHLIAVSTHSHPKVAADLTLIVGELTTCFNTQPPEGGCTTRRSKIAAFGRFQHTATRRWLHDTTIENSGFWPVSTHSHPKVAAFGDKIDQKINYSFNTQPPEGGCYRPRKQEGRRTVSTHSRTKAAAPCFVTRHPQISLFQHTAARRRLQSSSMSCALSSSVSTHSRTKAAAR